MNQYFSMNLYHLKYKIETTPSGFILWFEMVVVILVPIVALFSNYLSRPVAHFIIMTVNSGRCIPRITTAKRQARDQF